MADEDGTNGLGFDDPSFGFIGGGSVSLDAISDAPILTSGDPSGAFLDAGVWSLDASPQASSYDISSASNTTLPSAHPGYLSPSWATPTFDPRQQQQQPDSSALGAFGLPNIDPTSAFLSGAAATKRGAAVPVSKAPILSATKLSPALQEQLRNIAMPPHLQYGSPKSASSPESAKTGIGSSPDVSGGSQRDSRKRKISADDYDDDDLEEEGKPVKKTAHNMIEKRYRTNINDKIAALRDSVPSLRIMCKSARGEDTTEDREELHGLTPAHKLNKATVLSKATEYIRHLEKRNNRLLDENGVMHQRIAAFEKLFMAGAMNGSIPSMQQQQPTPMQYPQDGQPQQQSQQSQQSQQQQQQPQMAPSPLEAPQEAGGVPTGMIEVPEDMKRILSAQMASGQPYPVPQQLFRPNPAVVGQQQIRQMQQQGQQGGWNRASPYFGKLMVGSLAGLMILEAVREDESSNEEPQGRGLFALPLQLLRHMPSRLNVHWAGIHVDIPVKFMLLFGLILWVFVPSLFSSLYRNPKKQQSTIIHPAPSLASPISVRRRAWETAIQTVWVPHHNFFLEAAALMLKTLKLSVRNVFGVHAYHILTGLTPEQEVARISAWATALDAQLAGGDAEISMSRLILTLLASGTVPNTPSGLMLKALHVRVLLWDLGQKWYQLGLVNYFAAKIAERQWNAARDLNQRLVNSRPDDEDSEKKRLEELLPDHLAALVEQDCDKVLNATVIQRAHNLAFNLETTYNTTPIDGMDSVVDDTAIGSPMDALAAWWSTTKVYAVLTNTLYDNKAVPEDQQVMELAVKVAPFGSHARARAVMARSVLSQYSRGTNIAAAVQVLRIDTNGSQLIDPMSLASCEPNPFANSAPLAPAHSNTPDPDLELCLRCATTSAHIKRLGGQVASSKAYVRTSIEKVIDLSTKTRMSLLSFTSVMEVLEQILKHKDTTNSFAPLVERLAAILRLWMGSPLALNCGVPPGLQDKVINRCLSVTKGIMGMEIDTGYGSMTDDEDGFR